MGAGQKPKLVAHSTAMESINAQTEPIDEEEHLPPGGIPARNHKGERLLLYLGIIDILQSYRLQKRLEHTFKAIIHDGNTVSVHQPGYYAWRFLDFMAKTVFKKIPSPLKHSPSRKEGRGGVSLKRITVVSSAAAALSQGKMAAAAAGSVASGAAESAQSASAGGGGATAAGANSGLTGFQESAGSVSDGDYYHRTGLRPDVVPGDYDAAAAAAAMDYHHHHHHHQPSTSGSHARMSSPAVAAATAAAAAGTSPSMGRKVKPVNRQHMTIKQQSIDSSHGSVGGGGSGGFVVGSLQSSGGVVEHGTPSRLSVGTTGSGSGYISSGNTPSRDIVRTERNSEFISTSRSSEHRYFSSSSSKLETYSYQETEM